MKPSATNFIQFASSNFSTEFDFQKKNPQLGSPVGTLRGKAPHADDTQGAGPSSEGPAHRVPTTSETGIRQRLITQLTVKPKHVRGNKPRLAFTESRKQWYALKDELRQARLDCEWENFLRRAPRTKADADLKAKLNRIIEDRLPQPGSLKTKAVSYAERKLHKSQFSTDTMRQGGLFSPAGTDLNADIIRTRSGFFRTVTTMTPNVRQQIAREQGKAYQGGTELGCGAFGRVGIAERLDDAGKERFVAEKKFDRQMDAAYEFARTQNAPEGEYFSKTREFSMYPPEEPRLYTDLEIRGDMESSGLLEAVSSERLGHDEKEKLVRTIARQLLEAVDKFHKNGLSHQDIKPENFLISKEGNLVLTDFGAADADDVGITGGTRWYLPPEYESLEALKSDADKYALGMTLSYFLYGQQRLSPWQETLADIVAQLVHRDPSKRPSLDDLLASDFLQGEIYSGVEMLEKIDKLK